MQGLQTKNAALHLDELFYIYDQVKCHRGVNEKLVVVYEILSPAMLHCTECRGWVEKQWHARCHVASEPQ